MDRHIDYQGVCPADVNEADKSACTYIHKLVISGLVSSV